MSSNLKLFGVKCVRTGELVKANGKPQYFSAKYPAKQRRNHLAESTGEDYAVVLGPDHRKNKIASPAVVGDELGI